MKKLLSLILASLTVASALASCAPARERLDSAITLASSDAQANAKWLDERLEVFPTEVILGIGSNESYGVDMSGFEADGYLLRSVGGETVIFGKSADGLDRAVRKYVKAAETGVAEDLDETYHEGYRVEKLTIAGNDISEYTIYYNEDDAKLLFGVSELRRLVKQACGADVPHKKGTPEGKYIEFRFLKDDSFIVGGYKYKVENGNVIIEGVEDFGCPNAVYRFLEEECGWDGLTYGDSILAESEHVDVKDGASFVGNPRFEYFYPYCPGNPWKCDVGYPSAGSTNGGEFVRVYNGYRYLSCHGIQSYKWIPDEYWDVALNRQPCYSDEEVYEIAFENIYTYVADRVAGGQKIGTDIRFLDVSHPDAGDFCLCKTCSKVFKEEKGTNAGAVVRFINRIIEDMRPEFDGIKYGIFAYWGTQKPSKTAPDKDVVVTFCTDRCCSNHALNSDECSVGAFNRERPNQTYCEWIEGWIALNGNVFIWHYGLDNGLGSSNHVDTHYEDLNYFYEIGVKGVFLQFQNHGGFSYNRITNQLAYAINWDRDMTKEEYWALHDHYLEKDYGDGWEYIKRAVERWVEAENMNGCWHCWFYFIQSTEMYPPYMREHYDEMYSLAKKAIAQANSEEQEIRCVRFLGNMIYQGTNCTYFYAYDSGDTEKLALLEERWAEMLSLFAKCGLSTTHVIVTDGGTLTFGQSAEEEAWTNKNWCGNRKTLSDPTLPKPPAPEKYPAI